jgi:GT2 family glycosyltransferase
MLSICIPIYNYNVQKLVRDLHSQASALKNNFEIICIDDCSDANFKNQNKPITGLSQVKYAELNENIGRSKIRNLFLKHVSYDHLLFLDCDVEIISESFVKDYIKSITSDSKLICGGLSYSSKKPPRTFRLRWKYGRVKEVVSTENRLKDPHKSFKTVNFLIKKEVFETIQFDETITSYGHEDTWFGYQLKKNGVQIKHINNPVLHTQLETNEQFIFKTEQSIKNLIRINNMANDPEFEKSITLLQTYRKLKSIKIVFLLELLFWISKPAIRKLLVLGFTNTNLFASYKLGFLTQSINKK